MIGNITLGIYAVLLAAGGVMGFVKARSRASLISGLLSAAFAVVALALSLVGNRRIGTALGSVLAISLFVLFAYRYSIRNRKFMPSGLLAVLSLVVLTVLILAADWSD